MGYTKKKLEGIYLKWYDTISSYAGVNPVINNYSSPISSKVSSLDWQGEGKESVTGLVNSIDSSCQDLYTAISNTIEKVNLCTGPIYSNLCALKTAYDEYNGLVDAYNAAVAELNKKNQGNNQN